MTKILFFLKILIMKWWLKVTLKVYYEELTEVHSEKNIDFFSDDKMSHWMFIIKRRQKVTLDKKNDFVSDDRRWPFQNK